jgi:hypothetical protein
MERVPDAVRNADAHREAEPQDPAGIAEAVFSPMSRSTLRETTIRNTTVFVG